MGIEVPEAQLALSDQPKTQIDSAVFNRPLQVGIASGLEQLGSGAEDLADNLAKTKAQDDLKAVTLDANGMPQVATAENSVILGRAGNDYQDAMLQGNKAMLASKISSDVIDIHALYPNDAPAFQTAVKAKAAAYQSMYPGALGNSLADMTNSLGAQHYANIVENDITLGTRKSLQAITTQIDDTNSKLRVLARQGATDTDPYRELQAHLSDSYDALGRNKSFGYSQEKIDSEKAHAMDMLNGEYIIGRIDDTFTKKGRAAAFDAIKTGIDDNPNLDISDAERNHLHNYGVSRLSYLSAEQTSNLAALKPTMDMQIKALQSGNGGPDAVSDRELDQTSTQLRSLGAFKEAQELDGARIAADRTAAFRNLAPDQKASVLFGAADAGVGGPIASGINSESGALQYFVSKGWTQAQAAGIVGNLVHESGGGRLNPGALNPGDGSDGSDSIGIGQWNGTRAAALKTFAAAQGKPVGDLGTQLAFVQHELETSESPAAARLRGASTPQDAAAAFAFGYERPQGFQTGDINQVRGGQNRVDQANRLAGGGASQTTIASVGQPFTDAEAEQNPWLRTAYRQQIQIDDATQVRFAKAQFETIENSFKYAGNPGPEIVGPAATVLQIADRFPDQLGPQAAKLRGALAGQGAGFSAAGSPDGGNNLLSAVDETVRQNPGSLLTQAVAEHVKAGNTAGKDLLARDQFEYGVQAEWLKRKPAPIDLSSPQGLAALPQAIQEHGQAAAIIASHQNVAARPAFTEAELPQIKSIMTNGTTDQRTALLGSIAGANMSEPVLKATLGQLGKSEETMPLAVAGGIAKDDPGTARGIIEGQALKQVEPKLAPSKDDFPGEFAKALPFNDFPQTAVRLGLDSAVQSYYAKLSASAGDTTGVLSAPRLQSAIDAVTGGIVEHRGSNIIAPWRGASKDDTDAAIRLVSDADLAGSRGSDGIPLPASSLKPSFSSAFGFGGNWRLESTGDGKYLVFSGANDKRQYLGDAQGGKFILDLGAKRSQVGQSIGRYQPDSFYSGYAQTAVAPGSNVQ